MQLHYYHQDVLVGSLSVEAIKDQLLQGTYVQYVINHIGEIFPAVAFCQDTVLTIVPTRK